MTKAREKKLIEMVEDMSNKELLEFNMKFRKEKKYIIKEGVEFIQNEIDKREKFLRDEAGIDD